MSDAIPVSSDTPPPAKSSKKTAPAGVSEDVLAEIRAQVKEEVMAELRPESPRVEAGDTGFKVDGGRPVASHDAVRQDF